MSSTAALWLLLGWTLFVAWGISFAGGVREIFVGFAENPEGVIFIASPLAAVAVWVEARRRERKERREPVEKPE